MYDRGSVAKEALLLADVTVVQTISLRLAFRCLGGAHLLRSLGREAEGVLVGSRGAKKVPRLATMRSHAGGALAVSMKPLKKATWAAAQGHRSACLAGHASTGAQCLADPDCETACLPPPIKTECWN